MSERRDQTEEERRHREKIEQSIKLSGREPDPNWPHTALGDLRSIKSRIAMKRKIREQDSEL